MDRPRTRVDLSRFPSKQAFRAWLESLPGSETTFRKWRSGSCPLATWLRSRGAADPVVMTRRWTPDPTKQLYSVLPVWAQQFILAVAKLHDKGAAPADCLTILSGTKRLTIDGSAAQ